MTTRPAAPGLRESIDRHIIARITSGEWSAGDRIPSESGFMEMFGASRMTVHHALRDLTARGFLVRHAGSGTFVAPPRPYVAEYAHLDIIEEIAVRGARHRAQVLKRELAPAGAEQARAFERGEGDMLFHAVILHFEDDVPLELEDRLIAPEALPDCMAVDLGSQTLFSRLMLMRPYREGSEEVRAVLPTPEEQRLMAIAPHVPCLEITRRTWSAEGVVTAARMLRGGDRGTMHGRIRSMPAA